MLRGWVREDECGKASPPLSHHRNLRHGRFFPLLERAIVPLVQSHVRDDPLRLFALKHLAPLLSTVCFLFGVSKVLF